MKVLVPVKGVDLANIKMAMNPFDEVAVARRRRQRIRDRRRLNRLTKAQAKAFSSVMLQT